MYCLPLARFIGGIVFFGMIYSYQVLSIAAEPDSKESVGKEHGGKEHGGIEHGGHEHTGKNITPSPSADEIRTTIKNYVKAQSQKTKTFNLKDSETGTVRKLTLVRIHERVGKTADKYYSCADFKDKKNNELLDLDFDVDYKEGKLNVVDTRIHKVDGKERYTYDVNDNRIPLGTTLKKLPVTTEKKVYTCPMCGGDFDKPGKCPKCKMDLKEKK